MDILEKIIQNKEQSIPLLKHEKPTEKLSPNREVKRKSGKSRQGSGPTSKWWVVVLRGGMSLGKKVLRDGEN